MGSGGTAIGPFGVAMAVVVPFICAAMGLGLWAGLKRRQRRKMAAKARDVEQHLVVRSVSPYLFLEETAPMLPAASRGTTTASRGTPPTSRAQNAEASGSRTARVEPFPTPAPKSSRPPPPPPKDKPNDAAGVPSKAEASATATAEGSSSQYPAASSSSTHESVEFMREQGGPGPEEISRAIAVLTEALRSQANLPLPHPGGLEVPQLIAEVERAPTYRAREPVGSSSVATSSLAVLHGPSVDRAPTYRERDPPAAPSYEPGPSTIVVPQPSPVVSRAPSYREHDGPPQYQTEWRRSASAGRGSSASLSSSSSMRSERGSGSGRTPRGPRGPRHSRLSLKR